VDGLEAVVAPLVSVDVPAGQEVIRQGEAGTRWYLVSDGELAIVVDGHVINRAVRGDSFGALGLLRDEPHSATVRAIGDVSLLALERADFLFAVRGGAGKSALRGTRRGLSSAVRRGDKRRQLDRPVADELARGVATLSLDYGEALFSEGDEDDRYFVVLDGELEIRDGEHWRVLPGRHLPKELLRERLRD
jgi:CRP-like cAMP-binding protein